jgi:hypothetical protein
LNRKALARTGDGQRDPEERVSVVECAASAVFTVSKKLLKQFGLFRA